MCSWPVPPCTVRFGRYLFIFLIEARDGETGVEWNVRNAYQIENKPQPNAHVLYSNMWSENCTRIWCALRFAVQFRMNHVRRAATLNRVNWILVETGDTWNLDSLTKVFLREVLHRAKTIKVIQPSSESNAIAANLSRCVIMRHILAESCTAPLESERITLLSEYNFQNKKWTLKRFAQCIYHWIATEPAIFRYT